PPSKPPPASRPSGRRSTARRYGSATGTHSAADAPAYPSLSSGYDHAPAAASDSLKRFSALFKPSVVGRCCLVVREPWLLTTNDQRPSTIDCYFAPVLPTFFFNRSPA